jgi:hypothetical protein
LLSDEELDRIANEYARKVSDRQGREFTGFRAVADRRFALTTPSGVYYTLRVEPEDEDMCLLGGGGFFVGRPRLGSRSAVGRRS